MPLSEKKRITHDYLIVGEGDGDESFFRYLCGARNIPGFQFEHASGKDDFENFVRGLSGRTGIEKLKAMLIVGDNDETPDANFMNIARQIGRARHPQPQNPLWRTQRADISYSFAILMLPLPRISNSSHGCLESMLLQAAEPNLRTQTACLDAYCDCIGVRGWRRTDHDKMRLRCLMSASYSDDPNAGIQHCLKPDRNLIPLTHEYFNEVAHLLSNFGAWMSSNHVSWDDWKANQPT